MTCKGVNAKLSEYLDGELSGFDMLAIRHHITSCKRCESEFQQLRRLKWVVGNLVEEDPGEAFAIHLKEKVFSESHSPARKAFPLAMISSFAFAVAVLLTLATLHTAAHQVAKPVAKTATEAPANYDLARDQAYQSGGDPFSDGSLVYTVSTNDAR